MAGFDERLYRLIDVAHKHHGGIGFHLLTAAGEGAGGHVVLHDLDAILFLEVDARHFIKGHKVPHAHQADFAAAHVVEEVRHRCLTAGHQNAIG